MEFRTELKAVNSSVNFDHTTNIFTIGSCFAENIAAKLARAKFPVWSNPTGVLFNPLSIADTLMKIAGGLRLTEQDLVNNGNVWCSFSFHGSFSSADRFAALDKMNEAMELAYGKLRDSSVVVITFGTAWVYELAPDYTEKEFFTVHNADAPRNAGRNELMPGRTVANCHKLPDMLFRRRRAGWQEITERFADVMSTVLAGKKVVFTVSPVRHLRDGFHGNSVSKAELLLAVEHLTNLFDNSSYFPSYEIMLDDLRDYRFYAEDMVHPSRQAVDYIWEKFLNTYTGTDTRELVTEIEKIMNAAAHRPLNPAGEEYRRFCRSMSDKINELGRSYPGLDFSDQLRLFGEGL